MLLWLPFVLRHLRLSAQPGEDGRRPSKHSYVLSCIVKAWREHGPQATKGVEASATEERPRLDSNADTPKPSPTAVSRLAVLMGTVIAVGAIEAGKRKLRAQFPKSEKGPSGHTTGGARRGPALVASHRGIRQNDRNPLAARRAQNACRQNDRGKDSTAATSKYHREANTRRLAAARGWTAEGRRRCQSVNPAVSGGGAPTLSAEPLVASSVTGPRVPEPMEITLLQEEISSKNDELVLLRTKCGKQERDLAALSDTNKQQAYVVELYKREVASLLSASTDESDEEISLVSPSKGCSSFASVAVARATSAVRRKKAGDSTKEGFSAHFHEALVEKKKADRTVAEAATAKARQWRNSRNACVETIDERLAREKLDRTHW